MSKGLIAKAFIVLTALSIYAPNLGTIDKFVVQFFSLALVNFTALFFLITYFKNYKLKDFFRNPLVIALGIYFLAACLSLLSAININESIIKLNQLSTFIISLIFVVFFVSKKYLKINFILLVISISLLIDMSVSLYQYTYIVFSEVDYGFRFADEIRGLTGNKNVLAASLAFRFPFLLILATRINKKGLYIITFLVQVFLFYNIILLSARSVLLSVIISLIICLAIIAFKSIKYKNSIFINGKTILLLFLLPMVLSYTISKFSIPDSDFGSVDKRLSSIVVQEDRSVTQRLLFYSQAIDYIKRNPFFGGGIGNYKLISIDLNKENIKSYIVPYNVHNDFLEVYVETGLLGFVSFISFFLIILSYYIKTFIKSFEKKFFDNEIILLLIPGIIFLIDINLNFPMSRPIMLICLLLYISTIILFKNLKNE